MAINLRPTLRKVLAELQAERTKISRQIATIQQVLAAERSGRPRVRGRAASRPKRTSKPMSAAAKRALSQRMKAYWAKWRAEAAKRKAPAGR